MAHAVSPWPRMTRSASQGRAVRTHRAPATEQHGRIRTLQGLDRHAVGPARVSARMARRRRHAREDARGRDRDVREVPRGRRHQLPQPDPAAQDHGEHRVQRLRGRLRGARGRGAQPACCGRVRRQSVDICRLPLAPSTPTSSHRGHGIRADAPSARTEQRPRAPGRYATRATAPSSPHPPAALPPGPAANAAPADDRTEHQADQDAVHAERHIPREPTEYRAICRPTPERPPAPARTKH